MAAEEISARGKQYTWWVVLIEGILAILVGVLFLVSPVRTLAALALFLGFWWLIDGIFDIVLIFVDRSNWGWKLLMGVIGILAGLFLVQAPLRGAVVLSRTSILLIGLMGVVYGIMDLINAFRGGGWGAAIIGVISILLGIYMLLHIWAAMLALPWLFGILAIVGGIVTIYLAFRMK